MRLQDPVTCLKGIGPKKAEALAKLGIMTLEDMMLFFPRDYEDRRNVTGISQLRDGVAAVIRAKILTISSGQGYRGRKQLAGENCGRRQYRCGRNGIFQWKIPERRIQKRSTVHILR